MSASAPGARRRPRTSSSATAASTPSPTRHRGPTPSPSPATPSPTSATRPARLALAGPDTQVVDLGGKLLLPGFVEGHIHPFLGAFLTTGVDLQVPTGAGRAGRDRGVREGEPGRTGARIRLARRHVRPAGAHPRRARPRCCRTARRSSSRSTATACGSTATALKIAGVDREHPRSDPRFQLLRPRRERRPDRLRARSRRGARTGRRHRTDLAGDDGDAAGRRGCRRRRRPVSPRSSTPGCRRSAGIRAR